MSTNTMRAIVYDDGKKEVELVEDWPCGEYQLAPIDSRSPLQAVLRVTMVGICNTDLEICKGYVKGFRQVLGHEGVGVIEQVVDTETRRPVPDHEMIGKRVVVEINCPCGPVVREETVGACEQDRRGEGGEDPAFLRNHYPSRTVLGIIGRDGLLAERCLVPLDNCIVVDDVLSDIEAAFSEPLAAAYRIVEQGICCRCGEQGDGGARGERICVIGDGKLGLLIAHVLIASGAKDVWHFGRHQRKLDMVSGTSKVLGDDIPNGLIGSFDVAIEASGSPSGVKSATQLLRPMGTLVLKTTCSLDADPSLLPNWSELANDIVVNEKKVVGSRCGPQRKALDLLKKDAHTRQLVRSMVDRVYSLEEAMDALEHAGRRGTLKILVEIGRVGDERKDSPLATGR